MRNTIIWLLIILIIGLISLIIIEVLNRTASKNSEVTYYEEVLITKDISLTYYNTGNITSMQERPYEGSIAISPDLYKFFYPGEIVYIECGCVLDGYYRINDKTNSRFNNRVDVYTNKEINLDTGIWLGKINKIHYFVNLNKI
jgi:3D (Asp-Asp-Asp) domain-containing protein